MFTHTLLGLRRKHAAALRAAEKKSPVGNGHAAGSKQPFSDGSEEFFEEFTGREESTRHGEQTGFLLGLGVALGLFLGIGAIMFLRFNKTKPPQRRRWGAW